MTVKDPLTNGIILTSNKMENGISDHEFSDSSDFEDEIEDEDLISDLLALKPKEADATQCAIVVDGIPIVDLERLEKLKTVMNKIFGKFGTISSSYYPDQDGKSKGFVFIQFTTKEASEEAAITMNGYKLDKSHTFIVNRFADLEKYINIQKKWDTPQPRPYKDWGNLKSWLINSDCNDQFVIQYMNGDHVAVKWNTLPEPQVIADRPNWTESSVAWSPQGSFITTLHSRGIALWGGDELLQLARFAQSNVSCIDFSPCEKYIITYSIPKNQYATSPDALQIWEIRTGEVKRAFPGGQKMIVDWPYFKWSHDDKYFAMVKQDCISIFETETFGMLDKKSVNVPNVVEISWSPSSNVLAYWVAEQDEKPARVALMDVPAKRDIATKNIFKASYCHIYWQKSGEHCCMKVDRYQKRKIEEGSDAPKYTGVTFNLEVFYCLDKQIPCSSIEIKDDIKDFGWEPFGNKFCIITGDIRSLVSFYHLDRKHGIQLLKNIEPKQQQVNSVFWAPPGGYCLVASMKGSSGGALLFIDTTVSDIAVMNSSEHTGVTSIEWDPTGRYVATAVSSWSGKVGDYGYMMWNFQGQLKAKNQLDQFCFFKWRPRPPTKLSEQQRKDIKKDLKKYMPKFEEKDKAVLTAASKEILERRRGQLIEFESWRQESLMNYDEEKDDRDKLRDVDETGEFEEEVIEILLSQVKSAYHGRE